MYALSAVISSSGLSYRLMLRLLLGLPDAPFWHQVTLLGSGYVLSPLMPSTNARLSLLTPVYKDMVAGLRLPARGPAITALFAAMFGGAALFSPMMATSKSSNIAALGMLPLRFRPSSAGSSGWWGGGGRRRRDGHPPAGVTAIVPLRRGGPALPRDPSQGNWPTCWDR